MYVLIDRRHVEIIKYFINIFSRKKKTTTTRWTTLRYAGTWIGFTKDPRITYVYRIGTVYTWTRVWGIRVESKRVKIQFVLFARLYDDNHAHSTVTKHACYTVNVLIETQ